MLMDDAQRRKERAQKKREKERLKSSVSAIAALPSLAGVDPATVAAITALISVTVVSPPGTVPSSAVLTAVSAPTRGIAPSSARANESDYSSPDSEYSFVPDSDGIEVNEDLPTEPLTQAVAHLPTEGMPLDSDIAEAPVKLQMDRVSRASIPKKTSFDISISEEDNPLRPFTQMHLFIGSI